MIQQNDPLSNTAENKTSVDVLIEQRKQQARQKKYRKTKRKLFKLAFFAAAVLIFLGYWNSPASRVANVRVQGNEILDKKEVMRIAQVDLDTHCATLFTPQVKNRLELHPMIQSAHVSLLRHNCVVIEIEEKKPVGYRFDEVPVILFTDGSVAEMDESMTQYIGGLPMIIGFTEEKQTADLAYAFRNVDRDVMGQIAEIQQYAVSYDPNMIRLRMRDGNQFFSSYYSMETLNNYNSIASNLNKPDACIYVDEMSKSAYTQSCPGEEIPQNDENSPENDENSDTNDSE